MSASLSSVTEVRAPSPLEGFTGDIRRPGLSPLYTFGLAFVAFAMILLPAIYITLIGLVGWAVLYHLIYHARIMMDESGGAVGRALVYFGPAVAGCTLIFFMLKPLFARRPKQMEEVSLDAAKEPLLFAFVKQICDRVRAPMPSRIDVNCQVNASASFRQGFWSRDLVLTIGLPLAAGMDMRQFGGVLAHEFGHFAQGAGMRLTYVIRNINFWFARVVYDRDKWDASLERNARSSDFRIALVLHATRGCVWLTRRILWLLMRMGHALSCFMMRQMEYDADRYEAKISGSDAFASTMSRLPVLNAATQVAFQDVRHSWAGNRLPENLPLLIEHKANLLRSEVVQKLAQESRSKKTGWFDTHPCDSDRVKAAAALNEPGIFHLERPARELFTNFAETSKAVTRHQYQNQWKIKFSEDNLVASEEMLRESAASTQADLAVKTFYGEVNVSLVSLFIEPLTETSSDLNVNLTQWHAAKDRSEQLRPAAEKTSANCFESQKKFSAFITAFHLAAAGFKVTPKEFGLPKKATTPVSQETAARAGVEETSATIQKQIAELRGFHQALRQRATLALQIGFDCNQESNLKTFMPLLIAIGAVMPEVHQIAARLRAFNALVSNRANHSKQWVVDAQIASLVGEFKALAEQIKNKLDDLIYPFPHPEGPLTIVQYTRSEKTHDHEWLKIYHESESLVEKLFALHYRLLGAVLALASSAENRFAEQGSLPSA